MATIGTKEAPRFIHIGKILISRYVLTIEVLTINQFIALHVVQEIAHIKSLVLGVRHSLLLEYSTSSNGHQAHYSTNIPFLTILFSTGMTSGQAHCQ
jgi:hypothetical protein